MLDKRIAGYQIDDNHRTVAELSQIELQTVVCDQIDKMQHIEDLLRNVLTEIENARTVYYGPIIK